MLAYIGTEIVPYLFHMNRRCCAAVIGIDDIKAVVASGKAFYRNFFHSVDIRMTVFQIIFFQIGKFVWPN